MSPGALVLPVTAAQVQKTPPARLQVVRGELNTAIPTWLSSRRRLNIAGPRVDATKFNFPAEDFDTH
jgi:hypothetical protein